MTNIACSATEEHEKNVSEAKEHMLSEREFLFLAELFNLLGRERGKFADQFCA